VLPARLREEHNGPDKINEIRNKVSRSIKILNPDRQSEMMENVRARNEEFERELHRIISEDNDTIKSAAQKLKDELMDNARKQLTEKPHS
jgi:flagellar hook-basal body complex protein FliE